MKMPPRNPSELARLEDELEYYREKVLNHTLGKSSKELALKEVRRIENLLGFESKPYNSEEFSKNG
jgi:hypothetical protein